jgi:hypothetical protein
VQKFIDMISIQLQSKRTWASITSFVTLVGTLWFPEQLPRALGLVVVLQTWALSDAQRPATSKFTNTTPQTEQPFEVPEEVLDVLRQTMVKNAIGSIATEKAQTP